MKRFLSIFAIMAMIVSMFSGVAFAAYTDEDVELEITDDTLYYGENVIRNLRGKALNVDGAKISGDVDLGIKLKGGSSYLDTFTVSDGEFTRQLLVGEGNYEVGNYVLEETSSSAITTTPAAFVVVNEVELETPADLDINLSDVENQMIVQGIFVNGDGTTSTGAITLGYQDGSAAVTANYATEDEFGFLFNGKDLFTKTGDIGLYINGVLAIEGEIIADELDVSMSPLSLVNELTGVPQEVDLSFANALEADESIKVTIKDESSQKTFYYDDAEFNEDNDELTLNFEDVFTISGYEADDYTLVVELHNDTTTTEKAEIDFEIDDPEEYNLVNWAASELAIGSYVFGIGETTTDANYQIHVMDEDGNDVDLDVTDIEFEITYSGAGIDEKTYNTADETEDEDTFTVKPTQTGMIEMQIVVKEDGTTIATFEKEIEVTGWNMTVTPTEIVVGTETDIAVEIVNEDGVAINNAVVQIITEENGTVIDTVNSETTNISNGLYLFEDVDFDDVGKYDVEAYTQTEYDADGDYEVSLTDEIEVIGEEVYSVESDVAQLLTGIEETISVTVLDEDGDIVYPTFYQIDYDADGDSTTTTLSAGSREDLDDDGVNEAVELTVTPANDAVETVIRATTDDDTMMGEVSIEVLKPELVHTGSSVITENFETELEFTVVDPRDDSVMELDLATLDDESVSYSTVDPVEEALDDNSDDVWTATVLVQEVDWDEAEDEEDTVELTVETEDGLEVGTIEVVKATLASDPEKVIIGSANNLVLTYLDGEGNPLEDYAIMLDGEEIGETDENGQVMYATSTVSSLSLEFTAGTDAKYTTATADDNDDIAVDDPIYTELTVKSGADITGPVITAEVDGNTAIISIADDTRVQKVAINGEEVDMFFAMPEVTEIVNLEPGVNTFNVQAVDINNNYSSETLELEIEEEAIEGIQFTLDEESEYGTPTLLGNTTMIPVRFAENLGATVSWDAPTATVTYEVNDTVIELTIGSTTAVVNGENVQLSQAPYINELGRTMVPVRMVGEELGFTVHFTSMDAPITIK